MRQFQFIKGDLNVYVKVDIIDPKTQHFTIMEIRDGEGTDFQRDFPWWIGSTLFYTDLLAWAQEILTWQIIEYSADGSWIIRYSIHGDFNEDFNNDFGPENN